MSCFHVSPEQNKECAACLNTSLEDSSLKTYDLCSRCLDYQNTEVDYSEKRKNLEAILAENRSCQIDLYSMLNIIYFRLSKL
jgi:hypothetical protein